MRDAKMQFITVKELGSDLNNVFDSRGDHGQVVYILFQK